jgi:hypothetical protein
MTTIDLTLIFKLIKEKGYHHGDSRTNSVNDNLFLDFSTGYNGRGNWIELRLGDEDNDIEYYIPSDRVKKAHISNEELIEILKKL